MELLIEIGGENWGSNMAPYRVGRVINNDSVSVMLVAVTVSLAKTKSSSTWHAGDTVNRKWS